METEKTLTHEESLAIIMAMTKSAQKSFQDNSFYFLLWGWLTLLAVTSQFIMLEFLHYEKHYNAWWLMVLGVIGSCVQGYKDRKNKKVQSRIDDYVGYVWIAFGVMMFIVLSSMEIIGYKSAYALIIALYGLGTFITGGILHFKPLIWGGVTCWILSFVAFHAPISVLLPDMGLAITIGYIIPGYMLKRAQIA